MVLNGVSAVLSTVIGYGEDAACRAQNGQTVGSLVIVVSL